jgi:hypothetical protein
MLYSEIIAVCSEIHIKHINTLSGQNVESVNDKSGTGLQALNSFLIRHCSCSTAQSCKHLQAAL